MPDTPAPRSALVTGASRGLGRATALALAAAGVEHVAITYRSGADAAKAVVGEVEALGRHGSALRLDVADVASFTAFADELRDALPGGRLEVLVNNAGSALYATIDSVSEADVDRVLTEHVKGPLLLTRRCSPCSPTAPRSSTSAPGSPA